jgi:citrate lyase subunit beta/citryl-CoA lyase
MTVLRRTVLYVPADNPRAVDKARELPADVILDLEDAVPPERKDEARAAVANVPDLGKPVALRINPADTPWHAQDVAAVRAAGVSTVVLPKVRAARQVAELGTQLGACVWPMIETAQAVLDAPAIAEAAAATGDSALVLGTNDLAAELGAAPGDDRAQISHALQQTVLAGRAAALDIIDGVHNALRDEAGLVAEARAARAMGMTGKTVIHPAQIVPVNAAFTPDAAEIGHARAVLQAMDTAAREGRSVATLDGRLVEELHARAARRTLAIAAAAGVIR